MRREGIVKWFKEEKGYGRIMLDGIDGDHVFVHLVQSFQTKKGFQMVLDTLSKVKRYHLNLW